MIFETTEIAAATGAILAHSTRVGDTNFKKGRLLTPADIARLAAEGIATIMVARLEADDVGEDKAALSIAKSFGGAGLRVGAAFAGRANLYACHPGLVILDKNAIDTANRLHEAVTIATLSPFARVSDGDMVATVKIIPYAAPRAAVEAAIATGTRAPLSVAPFRGRSVALISTQLPASKASLMEKTRATVVSRLTPLGGQLVHEAHCAHDQASVAAALAAARASGAKLFLVMGASAISDRRDVIPAGIESAGGTIQRFGMPVDPGNLLLYAEVDGKPVIGLPGCARSPKLNGFDFVLQRLFADLPVRDADIAAMGVGGLLAEIPSRPQPRDLEEPARPRAQHIAAIVLAAGLSSRMGRNKLLEKVGDSVILRRVVATAQAARLTPIIVVTGHDDTRIKAALEGLDVRYAHNSSYADGLSTSLRVGIRAMPNVCDGALVLLGDMPEIGSPLLERMSESFSPQDGRTICVATSAGKRGNPVLWARRFFPEIETISGDAGAKHLIGAYEDQVCEIEADESVFLDVDTPEALDDLRSREMARIQK